MPERQESKEQILEGLKSELSRLAILRREANNKITPLRSRKFEIIRGQRLAIGNKLKQLELEEEQVGQELKAAFEEYDHANSALEATWQQIRDMMKPKEFSAWEDAYFAEQERKSS